MDFLQSNQWRKFQESVGRKTFLIDSPEIHASIIEHALPVVGRYFYIPRGPKIHETYNMKHVTSELIELAKKEKAGWIRIDPESESALNTIKTSLGGGASKLVKAPHDMQPKEILVIDISKTEEEILAGMKEKTRYNIKLSQKRGVSVKIISNFQFPNSNKIPNPNDPNSEKYLDEFIRLVKITSERNEITTHPESYYRKMLETIPAENIKLYIAEYENKIIAANVVIFYEDTATYLHGASDNEYRNVMAPYLLQWQAIKDAKAKGCTKYDFGGIKSPHPPTPSPNGRGWLKEPGEGKNSWAGITKFKTGFSKDTQPTEFPGSYDLVINQFKYSIYRFLEKIKSWIK